MSRALVVVCLLAACRTEPQIGGVPLRCSDSTCPEGLRCIERVCVANTLPTVTVPELQPVAPGLAWSIAAEADDDNGDAVALTWHQREGTAVLEDALSGAELALTFADEGLYVFEVVADDGYGTVSLRVVVDVVNTPPELTVGGDLYLQVGSQADVSVAATDADGHVPRIVWEQLDGPPVADLEGAGSLLSFTASELGAYRFRVRAVDDWSSTAAVDVDVVATPGASALFVAKGSDEVEACGESIRSPCRSIARGLERMRALGITTLLVAASAEPYNECVTVAAAETIAGGFAADGWQYDPSLRASTSLSCADAQGHRIDGDLALVRDVTLLSAATSGAPITVRLTAGAPTLCDVDVVAAVCQGCDSRGIIVSGGSPSLEGVEVSASDASFDMLAKLTGMWLVDSAPVVRPSGNRRSRVFLDATAALSAAGIVAGRASPTLDDVSVIGGLAPELAGIWLAGSSALLQGSDDGTAEPGDGVLEVDLTSFGANALYGVGVSECRDGEYPCCQDGACVTPGGATLESSAVVSGIEVRLVGGQASGLAPCIGVGIGISSVAGGVSLLGSAVSIEGELSAPSGISAELSRGGSDADQPRIEGNVVRVSDGRYDQMCQDPEAGALGLVVVGGSGTRIVDNAVDVGTHEHFSVGLYVEAPAATHIEHNTVSVAHVDSAAIVPDASGIQLGGAAPSGRCVRNQVQLGGGVVRGSGLVVGAEGGWYVANNILDAGESIYGTSLMVAGASVSVGAGPAIVHNTLSGGRGLVSRALVLEMAGTSGRAVNNLLDAGQASGRRFVVDNRPGGRLASLTTNIGQHALGAVALEPGLPIAARPGKWAVIFEGSGQLTHLDAQLGEQLTADLLGRPLSFWNGSSKSSVGLSVAVVQHPSSLTGLVVGGASGGGFSAATWLDVVDSSDLRRTPEVAVAACYDDDAAPDVVFVDTTGDVLMIRRAEQGWAPPVTVLAGPLLAARSMDVTGDGKGILLVAGEDAPYEARYYGRSPGGDAQWWGPWSVDTVLPAGPIARLLIGELVSGNSGEELVVQGSSKVVVLTTDMTPIFSGGAPDIRVVPYGSQPCVGDAVVAVGIGDVIGTTAMELAAACSRNGRVELFAYWAGEMALFGSLDTLQPVTGIGVPASRAGTMALGGEMLVSHGPNAAVELLRVGLLGGLTSSATKSFVADVAQRDTAGQPVATMSTSPPWNGIEQHAAPGLLCLLTDELHLDAADTLCADFASDTTEERDDFDALGVRPASGADIGADER